MKRPRQRTVLWVGFYGVLSAVFCAPLFRMPQTTGIPDWDQHLFYVTWRGR